MAGLRKQNSNFYRDSFHKIRSRMSKIMTTRLKTLSFSPLFSVRTLARSAPASALNCSNDSSFDGGVGDGPVGCISIDGEFSTILEKIF